ncbi:hypothetical protein D3C77_753900 [compost metagenome]
MVKQSKKVWTSANATKKKKLKKMLLLQKQKLTIVKLQKLNVLAKRKTENNIFIPNRIA